jgi:hypothetical protein
MVASQRNLEAQMEFLAAMVLEEIAREVRREGVVTRTMVEVTGNRSHIPTPLDVHSTPFSEKNVKENEKSPMPTNLQEKASGEFTACLPYYTWYDFLNPECSWMPLLLIQPKFYTYTMTSNSLLFTFCIPTHSAHKSRLSFHAICALMLIKMYSPP